jgi:hypothetical protein
MPDLFTEPQLETHGDDPTMAPRVKISIKAASSENTITNTDGTFTFSQQVDEYSSAPHLAISNRFQNYIAYYQNFGWKHVFPAWQLSGLNILSAKLYVRAYDVDSEPSHGLNGEYDGISIDGTMLNPGLLQGANNQWTITNFDIPITAITDDGILNMWVDIDMRRGGWLTTIDYSRLEITYTTVNGNHAPFQPITALNPSGAADTNSDLTVTVTGPTPADPDADAVTYKYRWFVDVGQGFYVDDEFANRGNHDGSTVPATDTHLGDKWKVEVTPVDEHGMLGQVAIGTYQPISNAPQNRAPIALAGVDQTVEQATLQGTSINLNGTGSSDPDGDALVYTWNWGNTIVSGATATAIFPLGTTVVTLTVTDPNGLHATDTLNVVVQDTTAPSLEAIAPQTVEQATLAGTRVALTPEATDMCDADVTITSDAPGVFPLGSTTVTFTAKDDSGNQTTGTTTITVIDTTKPVLSVPVDVTVEQESLAGTVVDLSPTATDICDAEVTITSDAPAIFPLGTTVVTFTATDDSGNSTEGRTAVTVVDTTQPVLTVPADVTIEQETLAGTEVFLTASATDICDAEVTITHDAPAIFPLGTTVVTFTATDDSGNTSVKTSTVTVIDTTAPELLTTQYTESVWPPNHELVEVAGIDSIIDICDADPTLAINITHNENPHNNTGVGDGNTDQDWMIDADNNIFIRAERNGTGNDRIYTIEISVTDDSGNVTSEAMTVTVPHSKENGKSGKK